MSESTIDQQFIEYVVKSLVSKPDAVIVERIIDEKGVLLTLTVDPEDLGRVIGKRGATAQSLRTLLRALGTKNEARYNLKIVDNGIPREERESMRGDREDRPAREDRPHREESQGTGSGWSTEPSTGSSENYTTDTTPSDTKESAPVDNSSDDESSAAEDAANDSGEEESAIQRTRRELEALDDLDV